MAPAHHAVDSRRAAETVQTLARYGADIRAPDDEERSPLHLAAKKGNLPAMQALLERYPEPTRELRVEDCWGLTPLQLAEQSGSESVRAYLENIIGARDADAPLRQRPGPRRECRPCRCRSSRKQAACTCSRGDDAGSDPRTNGGHVRRMRSRILKADMTILVIVGILLVITLATFAWG